MGKTELNLTDLNMRAFGQFSSLSGSFKELPKFVIPLLLDLSEFFETHKNLHSEEELKKMKIKIKAVEMKNDDDESGKFSKEEQQTPLETVFEKLLSSHLKGVLQKKLLLRVQKRLLKKEGHLQTGLEEKEAGLSVSTTTSSNTDTKKAPTASKKSSARKIKPFVGLPKDSEVYEKIFSSASSSMAAAEETLLDLLAQPFFASMLEKHFLKKKKSKKENDKSKQAKKEEK